MDGSNILKRSERNLTMINQQLMGEYDLFFKEVPHYVYGGVVQEERYAEQKTKLLFLLKEVIDETKNDKWSLVELIDKQIQEMKFLTIFKRLGELSYGFHHGFPPYNTGVTQPACIKEGLENLALINLKKTGGQNVSNMDEIRTHAFANKALLLQELEIIAPDLVICGGTFDVICEVLGVPYTHSDSGARVARYPNMLLVEFLHPGFYMLSPKILYAYFKEVMTHLPPG
ncbi:hypothetical protein [Gorillibacterium sp. CAU 1737]|uniref:hypothetical protein n=1 Tax=Gorillibacterium sp. CAU 1737 TaxID=3140362 RepID=UPI00325FF1FD